MAEVIRMYLYFIVINVYTFCAKNNGEGELQLIEIKKSITIIIYFFILA